MKQSFAKLKKNERGATAIEYALIASIVSVVIITALFVVGDALTETFNSISNAVQSANSP